MSNSFSAYELAAGVETLPISSAAPAPDAERLRTSYLDLLRLCLCDLDGHGTPSASRDEQGRVSWSQLADDQGLKMRAAGLDWPLNGISMVGLSRLRDLQSLVEQIVADGVEGDLIEAGAWRGGASIMMRATLDSLGDERTVFVADSFEGFPEPGRIAGGPEERIDLRGIELLMVPKEQVAANFRKFGLEERVRLIQGYFEDTMDSLRGGKWGLIRLDGDTYDATRACLDALYPGLAVGGYVVIDDYLLIDECKQAVTDFRAEHSIEDEIVEVDWNAAKWRRTEAGPTNGQGEPDFSSTTGISLGEVTSSGEVPILADRGEIDVRDEIERVEQRLEEVEREIAEAETGGVAGLRSSFRSGAER